jgi:peptidoglycan/LPS O-acetylase OafA/YrhL
MTAMSVEQNPSYRPDIDGLRAVAVLAVIGYHAYPARIPGGFVGVDVFFVISGFLISGIIFKELESGRFSFAAFYARRIRRIFPALGLVLCACLALGWFLLLTDEYILLGKHTLAGAAFGPNFVLLKESGYFDTAAELKPLLHLWSLGIEEQFYIVWPFLLVLMWRRVPNLLGVIIFIALGSFALNIYLMHDKPVQNFYLPLPRCWELLLGAVLAYVSLYRRAPNEGALSRFINGSPASALSHNLKSVLGIILIAAAIWGLDKDARFPGWWALLPTLGTFLIISAGIAAWINRKILAHPALVLIGLISYPLYLWHWPLLAFLRIGAEGSPATAQILLVLSVCFVLSWLTYRFWENPIRRNKRAWSVAGLVLLISLVGLSGRLIQKGHGFPSRFPSNIQSIVKFPYTYSYAKSYRLGVCFVDAKKQGVEAFSDECLEPARTPAKKIFLWGDSHAAHLYPGLSHFEKQESFRVIQFNASGCPPVIDAEIVKRPQCKAINRKVLQLIKDIMPDLVILAGAWTDDPEAWNHADLNSLSETIGMLHSIGIKEIILFGPVPAWPISAPKSLIKFSQRNNWQDPPDRLPSGFATETRQMDATMAAIAEKQRISYISPYHTFCNADGCLAKIAGVPTAVDCCHLTDVGSIFLIKANLAKILSALGLPPDLRGTENIDKIRGGQRPGNSQESRRDAR